MTKQGKADTAPMSIRAYAKHRGVQHSTVAQAIEDGRLVKCIVQDAKGVNKIRSAAEADEEWKANTRQSPADRREDEKRQRGLPDAEVNFAEARRRKEIAKLRQVRAAAEEHELAVAERRKDLISAKEMAKRLRDEYGHVRTKLMGLPTRCRQRLQHLTTNDVQVIDSLVREALEALADGE